MQRQIVLQVAYDGTNLAGYQKQQSKNTVQDALEMALSYICNETIKVYGTSRTDAGVHARGQLVTFFTTSQVPADNLLRALIAHMPQEIVIVNAKEQPLDWRIKDCIVGKEYTYHIYNHGVEDPLTARYHWHIKKPLDVSKMRRGASYFVGTRDFSALKGSNTTIQDPIKTIFSVDIEEVGPYITMRVKGSSFLYHMVRNMAGWLVDIGLGRFLVEDMEEILSYKDRRRIGKTAPPQGLILERILLRENLF